MSAYVKVGDEFAVNSKTAGDQTSPKITTFADGSFLITWVDREPSPASGQTIKAQLYDAGGARVGGEFQVNQSSAGAVFNQTVATLADGTFVVTWINNDDAATGPGGVKVRHYDSAGHALGSEFLANAGAEGSQFNSEITALGSGGFVITWDDWSSWSQKAQIFDASGAKVGSEFATSPSFGSNGGYGEVIALAGGGFVTCWRTNSSGNYDVQARIFDDTGVPVGAAFLVNTTTSGDQSSPSLTALADGGFVAVWEGPGVIEGQRFSAAGTKVGNEILVNYNPAGVQRSVVTALGDGGFMVSWETLDSAQDGSGMAVKARQFAADGSFAGNEFLLNTFTSGGQFLPDLAMLPDGRVVAAWVSDTVDGDGYGVRAQFLSAPFAAPQITSDGGGASAALTIAENGTAVTTVVAVDADGPQPVTYLIEGGADAGLFAIDRTTGALRFVSGPDFEAPGDADGDNVYQVVVGARDGASVDTQALAITVTDLSDGLSFVRTAFTALENGLAGATLLAWGGDGAPRTYTIVGGADAALFTLDAQTGALEFVAAQDHEAPGDAGGDGVYEVVVTADDGTLSVTRTISVELADVNEGQLFISAAAWTVAENEFAIGTVVASDIDGDGLQYFVTGGADGALFAIGPDGALRFGQPANFEAPADVGGDNVYQVEVSSYDGAIFTTQLLAITVTDVGSELSFVDTAFDVSENSPVTMVLGMTGGNGLDPVSFEITGGADAARFAFNPDGSLAFAGQNYEAPVDADGNNVYHVEVAALQGAQFVTTMLSFTVHDVNEAPTVTTSSNLVVNENHTAIGTIGASDPEGSPVTLSIAGGADGGLFWVGPSGQLNFLSPRDFEAPADANGDNYYDVDVAVSDGTLSTVTSLHVRVANVVESLVFDATAFSMIENTTTVGTLHATGGNVTAYTIVGGADAARFTWGTGGGAGPLLKFVSAPNYEAPNDVGGDHVYEVAVRALSDGVSVTSTIRVTLLDQNETPTFSGSSTFSVPENTTAITTVLATDPEGQALSYSISGGADAQFFQLDPTTGALSFLAPRDYEVRADATANNVYDVTVRASDGTNAVTRALSVTVTNVNEAPVITSNGGGSTAAVSISEAGVTITTVTSTDPENAPRTYSISGGADAARFLISSSSGLLQFVSSRNFEAPSDADANNVYEVIVRASDGILSDTQAISVTVTNVNEAPSITSGTAFTVAENGLAVTTVTSTDPENTPRIYSISAGADAARFTINATSGALSFVASPDFEAPADAGANNVYDVTVRASDGVFSATRALTIIVTDANEPLQITSDGGGGTAALTVSENTAAVTTVAASDPETVAPFYSIAGGADAALFVINVTTGALSFVGAPNFEAPADANADNVYEVTVEASDGTLSDTQALSVTVANVNEPVTITSDSAFTVAENSLPVTRLAAIDLDGTEPRFAISGGADAALFAIDASTGSLRFIAAPDFEAPADADADNVYQVVVSASDGTLSNARAISVTVTNGNDAPEFHPAADWSVTENENYVGTVHAVDPEGLGMAYFVVGGADAQLFQVSPLTGEFGFFTAPDFEAPGDADGDNVYEFVIGVAENSVASGNGFVVTSTIHVTVSDVAETLTFAQTSFEGMENVYEIGTLDVTGGDPSAPVYYSITGGADAWLFRLDIDSGALSFLSPQDFEAPNDAEADRLYEVEVTASNGTAAGTETILVSLLGYNEYPTIEVSTFVVGEGGLPAGTVSAADPENGSLAYALADGFDAALFTVDAATGALSFLAAPDFEAPGDANGDNVYQVSVTVSDGENQTTTWRPISVTVTNANEAPAIVSDGGGSIASLRVNENSTAVTTVAADDPEGGVSYGIAGGADAALFAIDASTGTLSFVPAPDHEAPGDADGDNVYEVVVSTSDGTFSDTQALSITVANVNEAPDIVSNGGGASASVTVSENGTAVTNVVATDPEGGMTYALAGGADAARFAIDASTGALSFVFAPDYDAPTDANGDNLYQLVVSATDGSLSDIQALTVSIGNVAGLTLNGTSAANTLTGGSEEDTLHGLGGADTLSGLGGNDVLSGGSGADAMAGGAGDDLYYVDDAGDTVTEAVGAGWDVVRAGVDYVLGDNVEELFIGGAARDGTGNALANTLHGSGSSNTLAGLAGDDILRGLGGRDTLLGGDGADLIDGGVGKDTMTGGADRDVFQFRDGDMGPTRPLADLITDFSHADAEKISLSLIDANTTVGGNQAFVFIGNGAFTGVAGQLHYAQQAGTTYVEGDTNGDGVADFAIAITGAIGLVASDFVL